MAAPPLGSKGGGGVATTGKGTATATLEEQILAAVLSTSNLLHLMHDSSPSQARLAKLPRSLLAKASVTKNTAQILQQLPQVISSLDEQMESSLQSFPHLKTVSQLLTNMENVQLKAASHISIKEDGGSTDES